MKSHGIFPSTITKNSQLIVFITFGTKPGWKKNTKGAL